MLKMGPKLFTLGIGSTLARNFCLSFALMPRMYGVHDELFQLLAAFGAVTLSHPFEVARVLIINNNGGFM